MEFFGFFLFLLGTYISGPHYPNASIVIALGRHSLYFLILPSIWLIDDSGYKITNSSWYQAILNMFGLDYSNNNKTEVESKAENGENIKVNVLQKT